MHSLRVRRSEQARHRRAFRASKDRGSLAAHRIHHRADIVRALLQGRDIVWTVREPGPALIKPDEPAERTEASDEPGLGGEIPVKIEVRCGPRSPYHVRRPFTGHLVRNADLSAARVLRLWLHRQAFLTGEVSTYPVGPPGEEAAAGGPWPATSRQGIGS